MRLEPLWGARLHKNNFLKSDFPYFQCGVVVHAPLRPLQDDSEKNIVKEI